MKIGKFYKAKELYWMLYPSQDKAKAAYPLAAAYRATTATVDAYHYSKQFNCNVSFIEPNNIFCLLEKNRKYCKVLTSKGELAWIMLADWCKDDIMESKD
jgi:hypothetical protein